MIPIIQHIDKAVNAHKYARFGTNLLITSFFRTIQGEGIYGGYPAVFVRTAGCNLGDKKHFCKFCDTAFEFDNGQLFSPEMLLDKLIHLEGYNSQDVLVITGGEPTLQENLLHFIQIAHPYFSAVQIETNGTQPSFFKMVDASTVMVVSPKASYHAAAYAVPSPLVLSGASAFKFVVTADWNDPHHTVPQWAFDWQAKNRNRRLYVSPMAVYLKSYDGEVSSIWEDGLIDKEATARNYNYAAKYAMAHNCLLSLQTHLFVGLA